MKYLGFLKPLRSIVWLALTLLYANVGYADANFEVIYADGSGEGFNDVTPVNPVGNNPGTTLGSQRRIAFEYGLSLISKAINSDVSIQVLATFDPLGGDSVSAALGAAGPRTIHWNFANAPQANTFFPAALANKFANTDLAPGEAEIEAFFNSDVDNNFVLGASTWYYGMDQAGDSEDTDFVSVSIHELIHGLGFLSLVDVFSGELSTCVGDPVCNNGMQDIFSYFIERGGAIPADFISLTDQQRQSLLETPSSLQWGGSITQEVTQLKNLTSGAPLDKPLLYTPSSVSAGSTLSHFDTSIRPDALLEPFYSAPIYDFSLGAAVLADMGWGSQLADLSFSFSEVTNENDVYSTSLLIENVGPDTATSHTITLNISGSQNSFFIAGTSSSNGTCTTSARVITCVQNAVNSGDMNTIDLSVNTANTITVSTQLATTDHVEVNFANHEIVQTFNENGESSVSTSQSGNTEPDDSSNNSSNNNQNTSNTSTGEGGANIPQASSGGGGGSSSIPLILISILLTCIRRQHYR